MKLVTDRQTDVQTDKRQVKHNHLVGGDYSKTRHRRINKQEFARARLSALCLQRGFACLQNPHGLFPCSDPSGYFRPKRSCFPRYYCIGELRKLCVKIRILMQGHVLIADWSVAHFVVIMNDVMNDNMSAFAHVGARLGSFFYRTRFLENNVPFDNIPL